MRKLTVERLVKEEGLTEEQAKRYLENLHERRQRLETQEQHERKQDRDALKELAEKMHMSVEALKKYLEQRKARNRINNINKDVNKEENEAG